MSIELEIKLGDNSISKREFCRLLSENLRSKFHCDSILSWEIEQIDDVAIGHAPSVFNLSIGNEAEIQCHCYSAGSEEILGDEGGWWLNVSIVIRNTESFLLMLVAAKSAASIVKSEIIDDSNLLNMGRNIKCKDILDALDGVQHRPVSVAAGLVANVYGVKFS